MKNLKSKIQDFLNSEKGRVGIKTPLTLSIATGGLMLVQAIVFNSSAYADECNNDGDCGPGNEYVEKVVAIGTDWVWDPVENDFVTRVIREVINVCRSN